MRVSILSLVRSGRKHSLEEKKATSMWLVAFWLGKGEARLPGAASGAQGRRLLRLRLDLRREEPAIFGRQEFGVGTCLHRQTGIPLGHLWRGRTHTGERGLHLQLGNVGLLVA